MEVTFRYSFYNVAPIDSETSGARLPPVVIVGGGGWVEEPGPALGRRCSQPVLGLFRQGQEPYPYPVQPRGPLQRSQSDVCQCGDEPIQIRSAGTSIV